MLRVLSSWVQTELLVRAQRLLLCVLAAGPVPRHVAFVMDGNRRYARMNHKHVSQGHAEGYLALRRVRFLLKERILLSQTRRYSKYAFVLTSSAFRSTLLP